MKGTVVALDQVGGRQAAAWVIDGQLEDLLWDPIANEGPAPGTICRAVVTRPLPGQGACIVKLPGQAAGYARGLKDVSGGDAVLVQVQGYPQAGKSTPVGTRLSIAGRFAVALPGKDGVFVSRRIEDADRALELKIAGEEVLSSSGIQCGLVMRSAGQSASLEDIAKEATRLVEECGAVLSQRSGREPAVVREADGSHRTALREWMDQGECLLDDSEGAFVRHDIPELFAPYRWDRAELPGGGTAMIEQTSAFVAVDVNTGADASSGAGTRANVELARCLPRHLRLRGIGGQVVIDFAPMPKRSRRHVENELAGVLSADRIPTTIVGWTGLGHLELHRRQERRPIGEIFAG